MALGQRAFGQRAATVAGAARSTRGRYPLAARIKAIPGMLADAMTGRWQGASRGRLLLSLLGIGYVLSPLDVLPELLLGPFGLGDDLAIAVVSVAALLSAADRWLDFRSGAENPPTDDTAHGTAFTRDGDVVEGEVISRH